MMMKIIFYITSLFPFSLLIVLKNMNFENFYNIKSLIVSLNIFDVLFFVVPLTFLLLLFLIISARARINKDNCEIINIEKQETNFFVPISVYFIPFITSNFGTINDYVVAMVVLIFIGFIIIKTNMQYLNPTILFFGSYIIYKAKIKNDTQDNKEVYMISKANLKENMECAYNEITENLYFIKGNNNGKS